ncbi:MAG TPA: N-acetylmuramoyl-L-alanine amidase [Candidatus Angelobacter sp.]|nr:N-acetylmuramoyl-L-alanine amidase [Candidatus Angelobacter sp.]
MIFVAAIIAISPHAQTSVPAQTPAVPAAGTATPSPPPASPQPQAPAGPAVVVLDPAHGGSDSGARGPNGVIESELVLDFARVARAALEAQGFRVVLTREGNQDPSFDDRSAMINGVPDAVFVSLHVSSTGPLGTVRAYSYRFANPALGGPAEATPKTQLFAPLPGRAGLIEWDLAQKSYLARSERLAELAQIQLAQKFQGSPETPMQVPVRQLRTVAAPAVAVEVSSVAGVTDAKKLTEMGQPLADSVARAVVDYRAAVRGESAASGAAH